MDYMFEFVLLIIAATLPAYVLGSINGAIIASKLFYRKDIRDYGSGNAGFTNFYRVFCKGGALLVIFIDVIKTVVPVLFGGWLFAQFMDMLPSASFPFGWFIQESFFGQTLAGFAVMLGHCFPVFYKFRGGKGVMAIGMIAIIIDWRLALIAWSVFIITAAVSRYISLGAILGSIAFPVSMVILNIGGRAELTVIILCALLVLVRHSQNIVRIAKGQESKVSLKRKKQEEQEEEKEQEQEQEDIQE